MGEPIRLVISVDAETERILNRWQEQFFPLVGANRSRLVRLAVQTLDRLGFTAQTVIATLAAAQRITQATSEQDVTTLNNFEQAEFPVHVEGGRAKPPMRISASPSTNPGARRRNLDRSISRRTAVAEMAPAYNPPFFRKMGPFKFNTGVSARVA